MIIATMAMTVASPPGRSGPGAVTLIDWFLTVCSPWLSVAVIVKL